MSESGFFWDDGTPVSVEDHERLKNYQPSETEKQLLDEIAAGTFVDGFTETRSTGSLIDLEPLATETES